MNEVQLDLVELKKLDLKFPYLSKQEIMDCWDIKSTTYIKWKKQFIQKVNERFYPKGSYLSLGKEHFNVYAWLHFANNYDYFQDKRLEKRIEPFSKKTIQEFQDLGVR